MSTCRSQLPPFQKETINAAIRSREFVAPQGSKNPHGRKIAWFAAPGARNMSAFRRHSRRPLGKAAALAALLALAAVRRPGAVFAAAAAADDDDLPPPFPVDPARAPPAAAAAAAARRDGGAAGAGGGGRGAAGEGVPAWVALDLGARGRRLTRSADCCHSVGCYKYGCDWYGSNGCGPGQFESSRPSCPGCNSGINYDCSLCADCAAGRFQAGRCSHSTSCAACPAGKSSPAGYAVCCAAGSFAPSAGATTCSNCPVGWSQSGAGKTACSKCTAGKSSPAGYAACCAAGSFAPSAGATTCSSCAAGKDAPAGYVPPVATPPLCQRGFQRKARPAGALQERIRRDERTGPRERQPGAAAAPPRQRVRPD